MYVHVPTMLCMNEMEGQKGEWGGRGGGKWE